MVGGTGGMLADTAPCPRLKRGKMGMKKAVPQKEYSNKTMDKP